MGHLINPTAMRIGSTYYWEDLLYKGPLYYPEYIHQIFKIKLLINLFFCSEIFEKGKIFFSKCDIISQNKNIKLNIYLYNSNLQKFLSTYNIDNLIALREEGIKDLKKLELKFFITLNFFFKINKSLISLFYNQGKDIKDIKILKSFSTLWFFLEKKKTILKFLYLLIKYNISIPYYQMIKIYILNVLKFLFQNGLFSISIFYISNEGLSAYFFARYIAMKLQQGEYLKQIIDPIRKDLLTINGKVNIKYGKSKIDQYKENYKIFKINIKLITVNKFILLYTWFSIEEFNQFQKCKKNIYKIQKINLFKKYWNLYTYFVFYFITIYQSFYWFKGFDNKYLEELLKYFEFSSLNIILNNNLTKLIFFFQKLIKRHYSIFVFTYIKNLPKDSEFSLLGFKIHLLGRFSRTQRASSIWYMDGKVPLNTLNTNIEYSSYTIPLFNSAINVKIYLNRSKIYRIKKVLII